MKKRSKEFLQVAFYLSKFGQINVNEKYPLPPSRLNTNKWNVAYRIFYEKLSEGRSILAFERSLKNARDGFDSHLANSKRIGWLSDEKEPSRLWTIAKSVFDNLNEKTEIEIWEIIRGYSNLDVTSKEYQQVFEDMIGIQESEEDYKGGKTEGGVKIITVNAYERSPSIRKDAIKLKGLNCAACGFNFEKFYGEWGKGFIEVHHIQPLAEFEGKRKKTNPEKDLEVLCANCHRMVHRKKNMTLTLVELKEKIKKTL